MPEEGNTEKGVGHEKSPVEKGINYRHSCA